MREMKDSGLNYLGEIPTAWTTHRLKGYLAVSRTTGRPDAKVLSLYRDYGIVPKDSRDDNHNVTSLDTSKYKFVEVGDFVINKMKGWQGSMALSAYEGIVSPAYHVFKFVDSALVPGYAHYLLRCCSYADEWHKLSTGLRVGQWDLHVEDFLNTKIPLPSLDEQRCIADYLDEKCDEIDRAVSAAERSIEEYKAYKNSVVFQAVTKGLDSDVPMADSGLDWIGCAPKHWDVLEQKWLMRKKKSICEKWQGESVLSLTIGGVIVRDVESGKGKFPATFDGYQYIDAGNLVLCLFDIDVTPRCVGLARQDGVISPAYSQFAMLPGAEARFYDYYLRAMDDRKLYLGLTSTMRHSFTADAFGLIHALRPPVDEQLRIANYLDAKTAEIDRLVLSKQAIIADLKAYKQSLIYEAVTGKREV